MHNAKQMSVKNLYIRKAFRSSGKVWVREQSMYLRFQRRNYETRVPAPVSKQERFCHFFESEGTSYNGSNMQEAKIVYDVLSGSSVGTCR